MRLPMTFKVGLLQSAAAATGLYLGFVPIPGLRFAALFALIGCVAVGFSLVRPGVKPRTRLACGCVAAYLVALIVSEPFQYQDDQASQAAFGLTLLAPLLLAIGILARMTEWPAAIGTALFVAASIAFIIHNGVFIAYLSGGYGFFSPGRVR